MGSFSLWHWAIVALVILVLFGRGRISEMMGDFGKGISSFKKGLSEAEKMPDDKPAEARPAPRIAPPDATDATPTPAPAPENKDAL
ncbi:MAG TPA: twin-arginine translocase TatA/TatE family subunit [Croceibacterium sp.]|nr:twin-arginine translocase TatA/TatE family subunit [Croceibacterium sp.]